MINSAKKLTAITLAIVLAFGLNIVIAKAAWTSAPSTPPQNNVDAPVNVGTSDQTKNALLTVKGLWSTAGGYFSTMIGVATLVSPLSLDLVALFNGKIGAVAYCDVNGANCVTSSSFGSIATTTAATSTTIINTVPAGAVMSFNLTSCPDGWSSFTAAAGRNVIGAGAGTGLTARTRGQTGGEEKHVLTVPEMAAHNHSVTVNGIQGFNSTDASAGRNETNAEIWSSALYGSTNNTGESKPFNVMDPYIVLLYCQKN